MGRKNQMLAIAQNIAREIIAEQTRARVMLGFDAALVAAHKVFGMGPGRAAAFASAFSESIEDLAALYVADCDENHDKQLEYAKAKRDELILSIVGPENFQPFDRSYGAAYMDELKRIRIMQAEADAVSAADTKPGRQP